MGFDPSGNFTRVHNWVEDRDNGIRILADRHDEEDDNFGAAFNQVFLRNGAVPLTGTFNANGNRIINLAAGSESYPGLTFELSTATGIHEASPNVLMLVAAGAKRLEINITGATVYGNLVVTGTITSAATVVATPDGTVGAPAHTFTTDLDCGMYRIGVNNIGFSVNAAKVLDVGVGGLGVTGALSTTGVATHGDGTVALPAVSFISDPDCGMYRIAGNQFAIAAGGAKILEFVTTGANLTGAFATTGNVNIGGVALHANGTQLLPSITFAAETNLGIWKSAAATMEFVSGNGSRFSIGNALVKSFVNFQVVGTGDISSTLAVGGILTGADCIRAGGNNVPGSGGGVEVRYNGTTGYVSATTRGPAVAKQLMLDASDFIFNISGVGSAFTLNSTTQVMQASVVKFQGVTTTASAANAFLDAADINRLYRSTSSLYYKTDVIDATDEECMAALAIRPITYRANPETCPDDDPEKVHCGYIAEEVDVIDPRLVSYGYQERDYEMVEREVEDPATEEMVTREFKELKEDAVLRPDTVQYERVHVLKIQALLLKIEALEARLAAAGIA